LQKFDSTLDSINQRTARPLLSSPSGEMAGKAACLRDLTALARRHVRRMALP
jgi:hypothetical protein